MRKVLLALTATFAVCLAVFAGTTMCVKKQNGDILRINVDDVYEVYFEDIFNPDTSSIIPPLIEPSIADSADFYPLEFEVLTNNTVAVSGYDYRYFYDEATAMPLEMEIEIPAKVKIDGKVYSVTSIGDGVFLQSRLTSIEIPSSVTSIGSNAFGGSSLTSIEIPSSVTSIGESAFGGCSSLTSIEIPSSVTSIGSYAFSGCSSLESINVDAKNPNYSSLDGVVYNKEKTEIIAVPEGIKGSISIPSSATEIGREAFYYCRSLTSIEIPSSVTSIGSSAFKGCSSLTSVEIPSSVTSIGSSAFYGCSSLESINVDAKNPNYSSLDGILYNKDKTEIIAVPKGIKGSISIPSSVTSIGSEAFSDCSSLTSVEIPSSVTEIGSYAFYGCSSLTSIAIPSSVTSIDNYTFYNCSSLMSVEIPSSVTEIGSYAFEGCSSLESINVDAKNPNYSSLDGIVYNKEKTEIEAVPEGIKGSISIPSSVTSIGYNAFRNCRSLTSVEIPSSVTSIGWSAFYNCENLDVVIDNSEENVKVESSAFEGVKSVKWLK